MTTSGTRYVVDQTGRKQGVLLSVREYTKLLRRLEDLEDALELEKAVKTETEFRDYGEIRKELRRKGRL